LLPVIFGCLGLTGIVFSTISAQAAPTPTWTAGSVAAMPLHTASVLQAEPVITRTDGANAGVPEEPRVGLWDDVLGRLQRHRDRHGPASPADEVGSRSCRADCGSGIVWSAFAITAVVCAALTIPLTAPDNGRPLRVLIIGRISTVHQNQESIHASYRYVETYLARIYSGPIVITHLGEQESGMVVNRKTIRQAEDLIAAGEVDLVIAEDLGRIHRNPRHQANFVQDAVDDGVRVICIADNLDTADDNWELMLGTAGIRHGLVVSDSRRRVRRTATHSFHQGGMVLRVIYGHRKLSKQEAESGAFGPIGLRIAKVDACTPILRQMRDQVFAGRTYRQISDWLNQSDIKPGPYAKQRRWTAQMVAAVLRNPILHGERRFREVLYEQIYKSGKHRRCRNAAPESKLEPTLAHFTPEEHAELLRVMDARNPRGERTCGADHPRFRVPRSYAIWPAQQANCAICGNLMYGYGSDKLKCSSALSHEDDACWNHVQLDCETTRIKVVTWLLDWLEQRPGFLNKFMNACWSEYSTRLARTGDACAASEAVIAGLKLQMDRLAEGIALGGNIASIVDRLQQLEESHQQETANLTRLRSQANEVEQPRSREELEANRLPAVLTLARDSYAFAELMKACTTSFVVVPIQDIMRGQVRPRVKFTLSFNADPDDENSAKIVETKAIDAFEPPGYIVNVNQILALRKTQPLLTSSEAVHQLGLSDMQARRALHYLKLMADREMTESFVELTQKPERASRWNPRKRS
jgi:site-specific DNA recombinase